MVLLNREFLFDFLIQIIFSLNYIVLKQIYLSKNFEHYYYLVYLTILKKNCLTKFNIYTFSSLYYLTKNALFKSYNLISINLPKDFPNILPDTDFFRISYYTYKVQCMRFPVTYLLILESYFLKNYFVQASLNSKFDPMII